MQDFEEGFMLDLDISKLEALVEVMYLAAFADGRFSEIERAHFGRSVDRLTEGRLSPVQFEKTLVDLQERLSESGRGPCIESIRERLDDPRLRWLAVMLAADMTAADGLIYASERDVLLELALALDVEQQEAEELVEGFEVR
jgi:tellurite resistance protein